MERYIRLDWQSLVEAAVKKRKAQGLIQKELAVLAGVSKPTLNRFEQGDVSITIKNAMKILKALGLCEV